MPTIDSSDFLKFTYKQTAPKVFVAAGLAHTSCSVIKKVAKLTKSSCEALKKIQEFYVLIPTSSIDSVNFAASKFTDLLGFLEPIFLIKECTLGDKTGTLPWQHFQGNGSYLKGVNWVLKKTKGTAKFAKRLHSLQVIDITRTLTPFAVVSLICDIASSSLKLTKKTLELREARNMSPKLKKRLEKWINRSYGTVFDRNLCYAKIKTLNLKIENQHKVQRACAFKTACALAVFALTVFCAIALVIQVPYLNLGLVVVGLGSNVLSIKKLSQAIFFKRSFEQKTPSIAAAA